DELHDTLLSIGMLPAAEVTAAGWEAPAAELVQARRAVWTRDDRRALVAAERVPLVHAALGPVAFEPTPPALADRGAPPTDVDPLRTVAGGWLECLGPVTAPTLAARTALVPSRVAIGVAVLEAEGRALRGRFTPGAEEEEWCDRRLLARIHRQTLGRLRRE